MAREKHDQRGTIKNWKDGRFLIKKRKKKIFLKSRRKYQKGSLEYLHCKREKYLENLSFYLSHFLEKFDTFDVAMNIMKIYSEWFIDFFQRIQKPESISARFNLAQFFRFLHRFVWKNWELPLIFDTCGIVNRVFEKWTCKIIAIPIKTLF